MVLLPAGGVDFQSCAKVAILEKYGYNMTIILTECVSPTIVSP